MFDTVLVANRGEIAVRVLRTLRRLGIRSVAVYSDADTDARHVAEADDACRIGPGPALQSYLSIDAIVQAAATCGADAVHPGYGFLSERAEFAQSCVDAGLTFIGPPVGAIELMGDKIRAKALAVETGVPVVPGRAEPGMTDDDIVAAAMEIGFPVLLKPSAGGGGKGMHLVTEPGSLRAAVETARREARGAFGDDSLFVERWVERPRHVEIQVLGDIHGAVVHLGERECSLQRRHQKIVEEAPSPALDDATRRAMAAHAVALARQCGYVGAGTVEFVVPADRLDAYFFLEMNTRLQVEHPVTELVTGLDLVELQVRVAAGEPLPFTQDEVRTDGHAVEARLYAEDPAHGFLPTGGQVLACDEPEGPGIRVDSGLRAGTMVSTLYDPMLAKVVAWAPVREDALRRLRRALGSTTVLGLRTNVGFLRGLLADPDVVAGRLDTGLVDRHTARVLGTGQAVGGALDPGAAAALVAAAVADAADRVAQPGAGGPSRGDRFDVADGWRLGERAWQAYRYQVDGGPPTVVRVRPGRGTGDMPGAWDVELHGAEPELHGAEPHLHGEETRRFGEVAVTAVDGVVVSGDGPRLAVRWSGRIRHYAHAHDGETRWLGWGGDTWAVRVAPTPPAGTRLGPAPAVGGLVRSPMPGTVAAVVVAAGQAVVAGDPLVMVEAMKMEHTLAAPIDGVVSEMRVEPGVQVALDEVLVVVVPHGPHPGTGTEGDAADGADLAVGQATAGGRR